MTLVFSFLLLLNIWFPVLRAELRIADYAFAVAVFSLPLVIAFMALSAQPRWLGVLVATLGFLTVPVLAIGLFVSGLGLIDTAIQGKDRSFSPTSEVWQGPVRVRAYCTNGGMTTDYGLWVRQERRIFPGVLLVHDLHRLYHSEGGSLTTIAPGVVRVTPDVTHPQLNKVVDVHLKPFF